jgi:hypothetical protein
LLARLHLRAAHVSPGDGHAERGARTSALEPAAGEKRARRVPPSLPLPSPMLRATERRCPVPCPVPCPCR